MGSSPRLWLGRDGAERAPRGRPALQSPLRCRPTTAGSPKEGMGPTGMEPGSRRSLGRCKAAAPSPRPPPQAPGSQPLGFRAPPPPAQPFPLACPPPGAVDAPPLGGAAGSCPWYRGQRPPDRPPKAESRLGWERRAAWGASPRLAIAWREEAPPSASLARPPMALGGLTPRSGVPSPALPSAGCSRRPWAHTPGQAPAPQQGLDPRTPSLAQAGQRQGGMPEVSPPW